MEMNKNDFATLLAKIEELQKHLTDNPHVATNASENRLSLTEKEIMKMPKNLRKHFRIQGFNVHFRKRTNGRYNCSYEIRYARKPYNKHPISVSATTLEEAKARFIEKLKNYVPKEDNNFPTVPKDFDGFAMYWFENFHKRKVCDRTYISNLKLYNRHIKDKFGKISLTQISPIMLQTFLDRFTDKKKTAKDLHSILNQVLNCSVKHGIISLNPLGMCFLEKYEQKHGTLITKREEEMLLNAYKGTPFGIYFPIVLYCGLRPNEYSTAKIFGKFIQAKNSKRHNSNGKIEYKYIPITPMLKPYLETIKEVEIPKAYILEERFKKILPHHKLYDMRTTFQTRCSECGISDSVIGVWMGNSIGKLKNAYTDFSKDYLLREGKKFKY